MKKFLSVLGVCTTVFTSAFICNKANAEDHGKAVFLGNYGVNKIIQCLNRACNGSKLENNSDFTTITNVNDLNYRIDLCGVGYQNQFKNIDRSYLNNAKVAVIVCNYGSKDSLDSVKDFVKWVREYKGDCKIILISNTTVVNDSYSKELDPSERKFSDKQVEELGNNLEVDSTFTEVSSLSGSGINELYEKISNLCDQYDQEHITHDSSNDTHKDKKSCQIC